MAEGAHGANAVPDSLAAQSYAKNIRITGAYNPKHLACVADYDYLYPGTIAEDAQEGNLHEDELWIKNGASIKNIGTGSVSDILPDVLVGYNSHYRPSGEQYSPALPLNAFMVRHGQRTVLGRGIAWSVNSEGEAVGDDRLKLHSPGKPVMWHNGKLKRLSTEYGTVYSIARNGVMVGDVTSGGFIAKQGSANSELSLQLLDKRLSSSSRGWHIEHAYAISDTGMVLAIAIRNGVSERLVMLSPV